MRPSIESLGKFFSPGAVSTFYGPDDAPATRRGVGDQGRALGAISAAVVASAGGVSVDLPLDGCRAPR